MEIVSQLYHLLGLMLPSTTTLVLIYLCSPCYSMQELARGDSFSAISSVGPNAAINHYFVNNVTDRNITTHETYLLDSGGQYV